MKTMKKNSSAGFPRRARYTRRGNVLVLASGILVLLVIVASSYLARTNSERTTALAQRASNLRDDRVSVLAERIGKEISDALFVRPVQPVAAAFLANGNINPAYPRLPINPTAVRYGVERATDGGANVFYHGAPYQVIPWTNWPDTMNGGVGRADDLRGGPGTNDTRWLRSTEPQRIFQPGSSRFRYNDQVSGLWDTNFLDLTSNNAPAGGLGDVELYTHWVHMSNILRPGNGWMVAGDISNIVFPDGTGNETVITNFGIPFEQWLPDVLPANYDITLGLSFISNQDLAGDFMLRWGDWFGFNGLGAYETLLNNAPPANFYWLGNLDGDNIWGEAGERPEDEFIAGTRRHLVSRVLADADGDGRTDSFWYLSPTTVEGGYRQVVAISIVDNSGLLNINSAGQFARGNPNTLGVSSGTAGHTPADLALHEMPLFGGELYTGSSFLTAIENFETSFPSGLSSIDVNGPYGALRAEFFDVNAPGTFGRSQFNEFLQEYGILNDSQLANPYQRLDKARRAHPLNPRGDVFDVSNSGAGVIAYSYAPFGLADELELRSFLGHNDNWTLSRFEKSLNAQVLDLTGSQFMRASISRGETSELLDPLRIVGFGNGFQYDELLHDRRRMLTTYSGARNDLVPPWLRWEMRAVTTPQPTDWAFPSFGGDTVAENRFLTQSRTKLDLREYRDPNAGALPLGLFWMEQRLPWALMLGLTSREPNNSVDQGFYFDTDGAPAADDFARTQRLSAAFAANILAFRDADNTYRTLDNRADFVPTPLLGGQSGTSGVLGTIDDTVRYMGMEQQPFLVEAFYGHLYEANFQVPPGYNNSGNNVVYDQPGHPATAEYDQIIVVQIANPYDRPIDLTVMGVSVGVFGHFAALDGVIQPGAAKNFYFVNDEVQAEWIDALNLNDNPEFDPAAVIPFTMPPDRDDFDNGSNANALELFRTVLDVNNQPVPVLIDRMDILADDDLMVPPAQQNDFEFGDAVNDLETNKPTPFPVSIPLPNQGLDWPGRDIGSDSHWIQWVRASRDWREAPPDVPNGDIGMTIDPEPSRRSPRYIFASRTVEPGPTDGKSYLAGSDLPDEWLEIPEDPADPTDIAKPTKFSSRWKDVGMTEPEVDTDFALQMLQKDADFEQIGELLHVWLFGHQLKFLTASDNLDTAGNDRGTVITFSEFMTVPTLVGKNGSTKNYRVNRLRLVPEEFDDEANTRTTELGTVVGGLDLSGNVVNQTMPELPAGVRIFDLFVLDGFGQNPVDFDNSGTIELDEQEAQRFGNARGYSGELLHGLINVNTAPREVLRTLPQWRSLVHRTDNTIRGTRVPEALELYRDKRRRALNDMTFPTYSERGIGGGTEEYIEDMRSEPGFASPAEVNLLTLEASLAGSERDLAYNESFTIDYGRKNPFRDSSGTLVSMVDLSTDVQHVPDAMGNFASFDMVAEDSEEAALLYAGASNLITSTSDVFTVYMQVRTFRRNPITGEWNALDPDHIIDDSRYVMVVDRSNVNRPDQQPRILFFEKVSE